MKHRLNFRVENRKELAGINVPIFADIRFSGKRMKYFTGYRIDLEKWDSESKRARKNTFGLNGINPIQYTEINYLLVKIESTLNEYFKDRATANPIEIKELLNKATIKPETEKANQVEDVNPFNFWNLWKSYAERSEISNGRKKVINQAIKKWQLYENHTRLKNKNFKLSFETFSVDTVKSFETFLSTTIGNGRNTVTARIAITKGFWNYSKSILARGGTIIPDIFGKNSEGLYQLKPERYGEPIFLNRDERKVLEKFDFHNQRLNQVRDVFIFQCYVGARVGDLLTFTRSNIANGVLSWIARKTKEGKPIPAEIPLNPVALSIIQKYNIPGGKLLPFITEQKYNDYIKDIFEIAGLDRVVTRLNPRTQEEEHVKLYEIASSHMARRTFIGQLFELGIDRAIITSMSGHVPDSKAFARYFKVSMNQKQNAINNL